MTSTPANKVILDLLTSQRRELLRFVRKRTSDAPSAEDIVQQVAVRAMTFGHQLKEPEAARAWVYQITRNVVAEQLRRAAASRRVLALQSPLDESPTEQVCQCILANMQRLPDDQAFILKRSVVDGASVAVVAEELSITPNCARVRLHRARTALRRQLRSHCGTDTFTACQNCLCEQRSCCEPTSEGEATK